MHNQPHPPPHANLDMRAAKIGETEQFLDVFAAAFRLNRDAARPLFYRDPFFDLKYKRICAVDGSPSIVSCLTVVPTDLRVGAAVVPMAGIAGVATRPDSRRQGYAGALLADTVRKSASELGCPLTGLFPADPDYYARFGFAFAGNSTIWTAARRDLPPQDGGGCRTVDIQRAVDLDAVADVHETSTATRTGACRRGQRRWRVIHEMYQGRQTIAIDGDGAIAGYLHVERDAVRNTAVVHEMHALTEPAVQALVGYLAALDDVDTVEWDTCVEDLEFFGLAHLGSTETKPDFMLRIADLPAALSTAHKANYASAVANESLTIMARDAVNPENEAPVTIDRTGVKVGVAGVSMHALGADIATIAQLYIGYISVSEAHASGALHVSDKKSIALAERLFPVRNPQMPALDRF